MLKKAGVVVAAAIGLIMIAPAAASADPIDDEPCAAMSSGGLTLGIAVNSLVDGSADAVAHLTAALDAGISAGISVTGGLIAGVDADCDC